MVNKKSKKCRKVDEKLRKFLMSSKGCISIDEAIRQCNKKYPNPSKKQ